MKQDSGDDSFRATERENISLPGHFFCGQNKMYTKEQLQVRKDTCLRVSGLLMMYGVLSASLIEKPTVYIPLGIVCESLSLAMFSIGMEANSQLTNGNYVTESIVSEPFLEPLPDSWPTN